MNILTGVWSQSCAGNILTSTFFLSAAHCFHGPYVYFVNRWQTSKYIICYITVLICKQLWSLFCRLYDPSRRRVRAGATYRNSGGQVANVDREFNHPSYQAVPGRGFDGDICVVRLSSPLIYNPVVQQGTIVAGGTVMPDGVPVIHAGWGAVQVPTLFV